MTTTTAYRPCMVNNRKALFHRWGEETQIGGEHVCQVKKTFAIIEYENGTVTQAYPHEVRFTDDIFNGFMGGKNL